MILKRASYKAIKYACLNFHYAKCIPVVSVAYSVFNNNDEWCGVITYGLGASSNMGKPYGLKSGQYLELTRMALNGKQESTSKSMSISMRLIKKDAPLVKLLISYADKGQNHIGTIYQATNWYFVNESESSGTEAFYKGKWVHSRVPNTLPKKERDKLLWRKKSGKIKYIYPIDKTLINMCKEMKKPYLKDMAKESDKVDSNANSKLDA